MHCLQRFLLLLCDMFRRISIPLQAWLQHSFILRLARFVSSPCCQTIFLSKATDYLTFMTYGPGGLHTYTLQPWAAAYQLVSVGGPFLLVWVSGLLSTCLASAAEIALIRWRGPSGQRETRRGALDVRPIISLCLIAIGLCAIFGMVVTAPPYEHKGLVKLVYCRINFSLLLKFLLHF